VRQKVNVTIEIKGVPEEFLPRLATVVKRELTRFGQSVTITDDGPKKKAPKGK